MRTITAMLAAMVLLAVGSVGWMAEAEAKCRVMDAFDRDSTFLFDRRSKEWEQCPGDSWSWAFTPNRHGFEGIGSDKRCLSFSAMLEWNEQHLEGQERSDEDYWDRHLRRLVEDYAEAHGAKRKVHGRKLWRWCSREGR